METLSIGHSDCLIRAKTMWVQDLESSPQFSSKFPTNNTLDEIKYSPYIKSSMSSNIQSYQSPRNVFSVAHTIKLESWCELKLMWPLENYCSPHS